MLSYHFFKGQILEEKTAAMWATKNEGQAFKPFKLVYTNSMIRYQLECCTNPLNNFENLTAGFGESVGTEISACKLLQI